MTMRHARFMLLETKKDPIHQRIWGFVMDPFPKMYTIHIKGLLHERWKHWFDGMTVIQLNDDETIIQGFIRDQSELIGVINQIHNLNLKLISVTSTEPEP
jgi:hypothetical protein